MVSSTPRLQFTTGKDPGPILQEAGWAPGPVWTGEKSRRLGPSLDRLSYRAHVNWCSSQLRSRTVQPVVQSLYGLSYRAHVNWCSSQLRSRTVQPVAQSLYRLSYQAHVNWCSSQLRSRTVQPVAQSLYRLSYRAHVTWCSSQIFYRARIQFVKHSN